MSDLAIRFQQAIKTCIVSRGTPYEANAKAALAELERRAREAPAIPVPAVTRIMRAADRQRVLRAVRDAQAERHGRDRRVPAANSPWRSMGPVRRREAGIADGGVLMVLALLGLSLASAGIVILGCWLLGYALMPRSEAEIWAAKKRDLAESLEARRPR